MAIVNYKKEAIPGFNPDSAHVFLGVDVADGLVYAKDSTGTVVKFTTTTAVAAAIALALEDYDLSSVVDSKITAAISNLIGGAPGALDTLNEIAEALADDANFAATITTALAGKQPLDADLTAVAGLSTNGIIAKTGAGTAATRSVAAGAGISVANGDGVSGNPTVTNSDRGSVAVATHEGLSDPHPQYLTPAEGNAAYQPLDGDLTAVAALAGVGFGVRTASNTWATRAFVAGTGIGITNSDGAAGNPTISNSDRGSVAVTTHEAASDPHPQYETSAEAQVKADAAQAAAELYADGLIASLVDASPTTLDTLNEIAAAIGDDPNFAASIATSLGNRLRVDTAAQGLNSTEKTNAKTNIDLQNVNNTSDANKPISTATQTALDGKQPLDADLTALAALSTTGLLARTGAGNFATRFIAVSTGLGISQPDGVAGNPTIFNADTGSDAVAAHVGLSDPHTQYVQESLLDGLVRNVVLTGLALVDSAASATDSILAAIGKLQGQLNQRVSDFNASQAVQDGRLDVLEATDAEWIELDLANAINNSSNVTLSNIGDLAFPVLNGRNYYIELNILFRSAATTTGIAFTIGNTGSTGTLSAQVSIPIAADGTAGMYQGWITSFGDLVVGTGVQAANTDYVVKVSGIFNCTTSGTLTPQFRSEVGGSNITVQAGSVLLAREFT